MSKYPIHPDEQHPEALEALYKRGRSKNGAVESLSTARVARRPVYMRVYTGRGRDHIWLETDLFDDLFRRSGGQVPPEMHIPCPQCGGQLRIDGTRKHIVVRYLEEPRPLRLPDGRPVLQTAMVSIDEVCECAYPAANGKGKCTWRIRIRDNIVSRV